MAGLSYRDGVDAALRSGEPQSVLDVVAAAHEASGGDLQRLWGGMIRYLERQPAGMRALLLRALPGRYEQVPRGSGLRPALLHLAAVLGRDLGIDALATERREALGEIGNRWAVRDPTLLSLTHIELGTGCTLPPATVATLRRSARLIDLPEWAALAARLTEPVLNVGERWSDAALADVAVLGSDWYDLVVHAGAAQAVKPTVKWERAARELLAGVGEAEACKRILSWLSLVGLPRTFSLIETDNRRWAAVNDQLDPFNADVLRGLVLMLACTGPGEERAPALGSLVDICMQVVPRHGPRHPKVANAAVTTLGRLGGSAALAELHRLATQTSYGTTRRLIGHQLLRTW